jgi:hypothetical protein
MDGMIEDLNARETQNGSVTIAASEFAPIRWRCLVRDVVPAVLIASVYLWVLARFSPILLGRPGWTTWVAGTIWLVLLFPRLVAHSWNAASRELIFLPRRQSASPEKT